MKTILVVDDTPMIRELLRGVLEVEGFNILEAGDGMEATEIIDSHPIDLCIVDIFLPKKGGLQVISELFKKNRDQQIIAISGGESFNPETILKLTAEYDVAETFAKPIDTVKLVETVRRLLD